MSEIAERYRRLSQGFAEKVAQVPADKWDAPTPCEGWVARDVVKHVAETPNIFFGLIGHEAAPLPDDPVEAFAVARERMQTALDDEATATTEFDGFMGRSTFENAVDRFVNVDLVIHNWDLSRAAGLDDRLADEDVARVQEGMAQMPEEALRSPRAFGPAVDPPADADAQTRLLCFLGRRV